MVTIAYPTFQRDPIMARLFILFMAHKYPHTVTPYARKDSKANFHDPVFAQYFDRISPTA